MDVVWRRTGTSESVLCKRLGFQLLQSNLEIANVSIHCKYVVVENFYLAFDSAKPGIEVAAQLFLTLAHLTNTIAHLTQTIAQFFLACLEVFQFVCEAVAPLV